MENPAPTGEVPPALVYRTLPIRFTGAGSEYFRIWIVNLLLLIVTFGIYWPWAKVRRMRYFMHNTLVDGDPMDFLGDPRQMLKGWALVAVLFAMYNVASGASGIASVVAFLALGSLWPALWRSSMRFRLGNTSWRGLRFRFSGSTADAYRALLPGYLVVLPMVVLGLWVPEDGATPPPDWFFPAMAAAMLFTLALTPWLFWRMKAYQHAHYGLAQLQTEFRATVRSFYGLGVKQVGFMLLLPLLVGVMVIGVGASKGEDGQMWTGLPVFVVVVLVIVVLGFVGLFVGMGPWWTTRLQNLVWTKTGNAQMRFISQLRFRDMLWLSVKNGVLMVLTLGLYWPFASVAVARLRLEAVQIRCVVDPETLLAQAQDNPAEAAGDAAGDFFGIDVGL